MTKHKIIQFQLAPSGVAMIVGGAALVGLLLAGAGYIAGRAASSPPKPAPAPAAPKSAPIPPPAAAKQAPPAEAFALRAATAGSEAEAKGVQGDLKAKGIEAAIVPLPASDSRVIYSVQTGHFASRREAAEASAALLDKSGVQTVVVPAEVH